MIKKKIINIKNIYIFTAFKKKKKLIVFLQLHIQSVYI